MLALDPMLEFTATVDGWAQVVRRCAWCQRVADADGNYSAAILDANAIATDGMCPACAARILAQLATRRPRLASA